MGRAIGDMLPAAVGVAISPLPIVAVVLMLVTARGRSNGPAFLLGWLFGITAVGTIVLVLASGASASEEGQPADWVSWLAISPRSAMRSRSSAGPLRRSTMARLDADGQLLTMPLLFASNAIHPLSLMPGWLQVLSAVNPKNFLLIVAGTTAIAQTGISAGQQAVALIVFVVIASIGVGTPVVVYFALGERSREPLDRLKSWMAHNNAVIMAVLLLVIGVKLIGDAIAGFSS